MDVKDFMEMIQKHSNDDWVKRPGMTDTITLGYFQGQQKHKPRGSVLSSVKSPCPSETGAALHRLLV